MIVRRLARDVYRPWKDLSSVPLDRDDEIVSGHKAKADMFNTYFRSINSIPGADDPLPDDDTQPPDAPGLCSLTATEESVLKVLLNLKTGSATGYDGVSNLALKGTARAIIPYMIRLFNCCLTKGRMPPAWKRANVTPIYKKGEGTVVSNYRPISLLSNTSKVLECLVSDQLRDYLETNSLLTNQPYGLRKGSSTVDQLLDLYQHITEGLDRSLVTKLLFLDISKAFDRVWLKALIHKLSRLGIGENLLLFFTDYLTPRFQRVVKMGVMSD